MQQHALELNPKNDYFKQVANLIKKRFRKPQDFLLFLSEALSSLQVHGKDRENINTSYWFYLSNIEFLVIPWMELGKKNETGFLIEAARDLFSRFNYEDVYNAIDDLVVSSGKSFSDNYYEDERFNCWINGVSFLQSLCKIIDEYTMAIEIIKMREKTTGESAVA